jgi:hypothetical protein
MKVKDVPEEWMALADTVLVPGKPLSKNDLRAALAAVIPAIQADALERAAVEVDCCCAHKADVLAVRHENSGDRWRACGQTECMALLARAIRALKEGA